MFLLKRWTEFGSQTITLAAEASTIYEILIDYDNYLEWYPLTSHSKLLVQEGDLAIAEFKFDRPPKTEISVECIHTKNEMVLHRRIAGNFPITRVQWNLAPEGSGTKVTVRCEVDLGNWRILYPGMAQQFVLRAMIKALAGRVGTFSSDFKDEGGRKFLEIIQTDDALEIWLMGKRYKLTPMED